MGDRHVSAVDLYDQLVSILGHFGDAN
jgi:hypothetical protein